MWLAAFSSNCPVKVAINYGEEKPFMFNINNDHTIPYLIERYTLPPIKQNLEFLVDCQRLQHNPTIDGLSIQFPSGSFEPLSAQSRIPITRFDIYNGFHYFEVKVENQPGGSSPFLSFGLGMRPYPQRHHVGWNQNSIGLHRYRFN